MMHHLAKCSPEGSVRNQLNPSQFRKYLRLLTMSFFLTLPLINPWVRGDGVAYYAYIRAMLIEHRLDFAKDWRSANESFVMRRVRPDGTIDPLQYTSTGHLSNHCAVGAAILWAPFLVPVHGALLILQKLGFRVQVNGYSRPYLITMALATALYGFVALLLSFRLAALYSSEHSAFLSTLGIWFASSLSVYMYFNPSWSHAPSAFTVALFLWYWDRTRGDRKPMQWVTLGLLSGLMLDVYYPSIAILLIPALESLRQYGQALRGDANRQGWIWRLFVGNVVYCCAVLVAFLPTLITRQIIYGNPLDLGYSGEWTRTPALLSVLFSSDHGLLTWTPILLIALGGLILLGKRDRELAVYLLVSFFAYYLVVCFHTAWDGLSSFGNRFFISLTPVFVLGLASAISSLEGLLNNQRKARVIAGSLTAALIVWNAAFIFQWGTHLVPARGPISWKQMIRNQFVTVPMRATSELAAYFGDRRALMRHIEDEDVRQLNRHEYQTGNARPD